MHVHCLYTVFNVQGLFSQSEAYTIKKNVLCLRIYCGTKLSLQITENVSELFYALC